MKILHLSPHVGGGVGTVVLSYLEHVAQVTNDIHKIICLDYINENAEDRLSIAGVEFKDELGKDHTAVLSEISNADLVVVHWWNHPLLYDFFVKASLPPCRLIIWAHISGSPPPNCFTEKIFNYPDIFVFTTPLSFYDPLYQALPESTKKKVRVIWSTGGVERLQKYNVGKLSSKTSQVGYVGNLDFTKLHPNFVEICDSIPLIGVEYVVIGPENKILTSLVEKSDHKKNYHLTGFISEEEKYRRLNNFTCFGYPLARHHYATCDQTIQEAMALGVVPVVLSNPMESYMVSHGETGLVARNLEEYKVLVAEVCTNQKLRLKLSYQSQRFANNEYSIYKTIQNWDKVFVETLNITKSPKRWPIESSDKENVLGHNVFIESLGIYGGLFKDFLNCDNNLSKVKITAQIKSLASYAQWTSRSKSTVHHYLFFFPNDQHLKNWAEMTLGEIK